MRSSAAWGSETVTTRDFLLPDLGEGLTEGEIVNWLVAVGDTVDLDQPVAEIETAKAVVEVPSPYAGTVVALHGEVGAEVEVGKPLVTVEVGVAGPVPAGAGPAVAGPAVAGPDLGTSALVPDPSTSTVDGAEQGTIVGGPPAEGGSGNVLVGYGTSGSSPHPSRRRRRGPAGAPGQTANGVTAAAALAASPATPVSPRALATPPVRKLAREVGLDLGAIAGSGLHGAVTRDDLAAAIRARDEAPRPDEVGVVVTTPDAEPLGSAPPNTREELAPPGLAPPAPGAETAQRIPVRGVRRLTAEKMSRSRREIPEATTWVDCDASELVALRDRLNARQDAVRVTPLAVVLRAVVAGLREHPLLNARLDTDANEIVVGRAVHLGFAAQTDRGLVVPVIRDADRRSILDLARELNRLAGSARAGTLTPGDMAAGTFTVSNYGAFGVDGGSAVINHPEAAILGVGRIADRAWVVQGELAVRKVLQLSIAFDHRICDGADAAGFLRFVADCVEDPAFLLAAL